MGEIQREQFHRDTTRAPKPTPHAGYRAWSTECCRSCYAWLPSLDLRLAPVLPLIHLPFDDGETYWAVQRALRAPVKVAA